MRPIHLDTPAPPAGARQRPAASEHELRAIDAAMSLHPAVGMDFLEPAPLVHPGDVVWVAAAGRMHRGVADSGDEGPVRVLYVTTDAIELARPHATGRDGQDAAIGDIVRAVRDGRAHVDVGTVVVPRDQVLKHPSAAAADREHLAERRRAQRREQRLHKEAGGPLHIGRIFTSEEVAGRAIAHHLGLQIGLAGWLWHGQLPVSPGYAQLAAALSVHHGVLDHPAPGDYRYRLAALPDPDTLIEAIVTAPNWERDSRHVRKLAECGIPGTQLLIDHGRGATEIAVSEGVVLNVLEALASVPGNSMLHGLRIRHADGTARTINPSLFFAILLPVETARHRWWGLDHDGHVAAGPYPDEQEARRAADRIATVTQVRHGHPAAQPGATQPALREVVIAPARLHLADVLADPGDSDD
jgi:hypothetical protein